MSAIQPTASRHHLIRFAGRKTIHAATLGLDNAWHTACGERVIRELTHEFDNEAHIFETEKASLCKRCDRVGSVLL